ncbi:MAG: M23 family metallopeptidase [Candidatus Blackburnbacteria bacterium]|nr:M23 family metallopeptidase [Candidatus Blackburnbacteria bacterium]
MASFIKQLLEFIFLWSQFLSKQVKHAFFWFENYKHKLAELLYRQRGKFARPFVHSGMGALAAVGVMLAPIISEEFPRDQRFLQAPPPSAVLAAATENPELATLQSEKVRDKIYTYSIQEGDTISGVAEKFGVSQETVLWQNNLSKNSKLKAGQTLEILPVTGVSHKVQKGDTIYSIAKKFSAEPQAIVDFPFNTFVNDETFALAVGQQLIIPDGAPPKQAPSGRAFAKITPDAGAVTASGEFAWPASGYISQGFAFYHKAIDIANPGSPDVLAADSGTITYAGCTAGGYGCHVRIDHGNGYRTLYAHFSRIYVEVGQTVKRGSAIGKMGSTGRSTGIHTHFEVSQNGAMLNPLQVLR